jgi:molecular chaperone GrpE (heat shock protein)
MEKWRREEEAERAAKALKDSTAELLRVIDAWAETKRLEAFFADAERRARDLPDEQRERTIERLRQARALIGSTDALERFNAWRAPEERQNRFDFSQSISRINLGVS